MRHAISRKPANFWKQTQPEINHKTFKWILACAFLLGDLIIFQTSNQPPKHLKITKRSPILLDFTVEKSFNRSTTAKTEKSKIYSGLFLFYPFLNFYKIRKNRINPAFILENYFVQFENTKVRINKLNSFDENLWLIFPFKLRLLFWK